MSDQAVNSSWARAVAAAYAKSYIAEYLPQGDIPILQEEYVKNEDCWIFFRNPAIVIPATTMRIGADWAFAVGRLGEVIVVPVQYGDRGKIEKHLGWLSKYYTSHDANGNLIQLALPAP